MLSDSLAARIGARWQNRIGSLREYEVIRDGNVFATSFADSYLYVSEYDRARQLKERLLQEYEGVAFDEVFSGQAIRTEWGECFALHSDEAIRLPPPDPEAVMEAILSDLTLVYGIGEKTAHALRGRGFRTICDLVSHPRHRNYARALLRNLGEGDITALIGWLARRYSGSHPLVLGTADFLPPESLVFLDIETLGLFSRPIILFGVGRVECGRITVSQYLLRDVGDEPAALLATLAHLEGERAALVTFNGKTFDLPYIRDRLAYFGLPALLDLPHFDLLHFARRRWRDRLPNCRLSTLERRLFDIERKDDLPSQMVPEFYESYIMTGNCGPLVPVVEHNRQDVVSLARVYARLAENAHAAC
jgi:uncharacterized protein YprB with RNaseH-like and TPR domain